MTAQRTDEEASTAPVGQEDPGADVAGDSTALTTSGAAATDDSASATASSDDAAPMPPDGFVPAETSGQGQAAGGQELGDAASVQDRVSAAVDALVGSSGPEAPAMATAAPATNGQNAALQPEPAAASAALDATADVPAAAAPPSAEASTSFETATPSDVTPADTAAAAAGDDATAMATPTFAPDQDAGAGALATDVEPASAAASAPDASTAAPDAPTAVGDDASAVAGGLDEIAADELSAAPAAEADEPAPYVETRPEPTTMEELLNEQSGDIRSFKHGDVVEGNVVRIDKDEILVDIGAKSEGVVSNRELYGRHGEAQPQLNIGDTVLVYVLQPESNEGHAVLSLRRAGLERKWRSMQEQFDAGVIIEAPVIDHNKGGLIVDCGIRGFVPISQIVDFPRRPQNEQPRDAAQEIAEKLQPFVGRKLRLKILEVNRKANRLILSEKVALYEERREKRDELFSSLQVGQKVTGSVRSIAPFGVFVDLGGIDGLVHKSELSWNKVNNPEHGYKVGEEVEAEVIDINHERGRISLSIRRLQPDPWHSTVADLKVNDLIDGTVTKIVNFGAFVRVRDGLEGLIHISELSHQRVAHPGDVVHEGQRLKLKIISLDSERHRLGLSLKQAEEAPARPASEPRPDRGPRQRSERSFDAAQAVQEPEGGIDNTLAAAFAQVRQQVAQSERARTEAEMPEDDAGATVASETERGGTGQTVADTLNELPGDSEVPEPETADAPAMEVGIAGGGTADSATADSGASTAADSAPADAGAVTTADSTTADAGAMAETAPAADVDEAATTDDSGFTAGVASSEEVGTDAADATAGATEVASVDQASGQEDAPSAAPAAGAAEAAGSDGSGLVVGSGDDALDAASGADALDQGSAADQAPSVDETGVSSGATEGSATGSDAMAGAGDEPVEGATDAAPADGADREG